MQIQVKLMGMLKDKAPPQGTLDLPPEATIEDALQQLGIGSDAVQVFTVNGQLVHDRGHVLQPEDEFTVLPPVGGG